MAIDTISRALSGQASTAAKQAKETADSAMEQAIAAVPGAVSDWLEDNVTPTTPVVDASLSIAGAAADAKATGDGIADLKSALMHSEVIQFTEGYYYNCRSNTLPGRAASASMRYAELACNAGDVFLINATTTNQNTRGIFAFWDANGVNLLNSAGNITLYNYMVVAPASAKKLIINDVISNPALVSYKKLPTLKYIDSIRDELIKTTGGEVIPYISGYYCSVVSTTDLRYSINPNYRCATLEVSPGDVFTLNNSVSNNTIGLYAFIDSSLNIIQKGLNSGVLKNTVVIAPEGAKYLVINDNGMERNCYKGLHVETSDLLDTVNSVSVLAFQNQRYRRVTGNLADGGYLIMPAEGQMSEKNERTVFSGAITEFSKIFIGISSTADLGNAANRYNCFEVNTTSIVYKAQPTSSPVSVEHGLTIENNLQIIIECKSDGICDFSVISNGHLFKQEFSYNNLGVRRSFIYSDASTMTHCSLSWTCSQLNKKIWFMGDSYLSYSEDRWIYYLSEYNYRDNILVNAFPGATGAQIFTGFNQLMESGKPKFAVWCCGMNDGSDNSSEASSSWVSAKNSFLARCNDAGVTPIFATIPTVPTINHEKKNEWVRSSGYRYIDFAAAVGAQSDGIWYSGMLSNDGVHPSQYGAKALFAQVLVDLPEIMVSDFA